MELQKRDTNLVKGYLEGIKDRGMPEMVDLVDSLQDLGGRILVCDLCLEATDSGNWRY
jgi:hypothetical protein